MANFGYMEHTSRLLIGVKTPPKEKSIFDHVRRKNSFFFTFLVNLFFRPNCENACSVIHFPTNQMPIKLNSKKKTKCEFSCSSIRWVLRPILIQSDPSVEKCPFVWRPNRDSYTVESTHFFFTERSDSHIQSTKVLDSTR